ncbi:MAG: hypothetical protein JF588_23410 [Caulobacterales bacterium]|nr:hypothetical protein [Caulobacterales bacterium]
MATYSFETITAAQARGFSPTADTLVFGAGETAAGQHVVLSGATAAITSAAGRTVILPGGLLGEHATSFTDGSRLQVGTAAGEYVVGGAGRDALYGGEGADTLTGAGAADLLYGGGGADVFYVSPGTSAATGDGMDRVMDWTAGDKLLFAGAAGTATNYVELSAASFTDALALANDRIAGGVIDYVAVAVGSDVLVFADSRGDNGHADDAVTLVGRRLDDIGFGDIAGATHTEPTPTTPPPTTPPPTTPPTPTTSPSPIATTDPVSLTGTAGADSLEGGRGSDTISGLDGDDRLTGGDGNDVLQGGAGLDSLLGGGGDDSLQAGDGADYLNGGPGHDSLAGGGGVDTFYLTPGDSPAGDDPGGLDHIVDWSADDHILFSGAAVASVANYREITVDSYAAAREQAVAGYKGQGVEYTVAQVGHDLFVFAPRVEQAVALTGHTLDDISAANIGIVGSATTAPTTPGLEPTAQKGTAGDDILGLGDGAQNYDAGGGNDLIDGGAGNDTVAGGEGADILRGGTGDDVLQGGSGEDYLRGDDGADSLSGGDDFDDINGNAGADTASGGGGDDWVVGGKDNDSLSGDAGDDLIYGNLGADTLSGGDGADVMRGGQDNDSLSGGAGNDYLSGDKGDDTLTGGAGADLFHTFGDAGLDRVTDFHAAEGDRVQLDPGTVYTLAQVGADTVINMTGGGQMVLVGVDMASLPSGWIFGA